MESLTGLEQLLSSAVISALVAAMVTLRTSERKIQIENITQERAKWRDKIRSNSLAVHKAATSVTRVQLAELVLVFRLDLNPGDDRDLQILACIDRMRHAVDPKQSLPEFSKRIALLLKHDWERAKHEARPWFIFWGEPRRTDYVDDESQTQ